MPSAYIKKSGDNLVHTTSASDADRFVLNEAEQGKYYIYDRTAGCYIYYTNVANGSNQTTTANSNVKYTSDKATTNTRQ